MKNKLFIENTSQSFTNFDLSIQAECVVDKILRLISNRPYHIDGVIRFCDEGGLCFWNKLLEDENYIYVPVSGYLEEDDDRYLEVFNVYEKLCDKIELANYCAELANRN